MNPQAGAWRVSVSAPASVGFVLQFQTCPTGDVVPTVEAALAPLYGSASDAVEGVFGGWLSILVKAAVAAVAGVVVAALVVVPGGQPLAVAAGLATFAAVGLAEAELSLPQVDTFDLSRASTQIGGMAGFLVSTDVLLLIDANVDGDEVTPWAYQARQQALYPYVTASIFNKNQSSLVGPDTTRVRVQAALRSYGSGYVTACGHGLPFYLTGWYQSGTTGPLQSILEKGKYDPAEVGGKIIHMLACHCGYLNNGLGMDVVKNGAVAFFGYSDSFLLRPTQYRAYCAGDIALDMAMIDGNTCEEAYQAAIATYNKYIAKYRKNGDYEDAATLEKDRDRLVGPSVDSRFGDKDARLGAPKTAVTG